MRGCRGQSPRKKPESFIRVRDRQVRLWRPVQVRSLRSAGMTAILLRKNRANLLQSCSPAGGCRKRNLPIQWPQAEDWSNRKPQNRNAKSPLCAKHRGFLFCIKLEKDSGSTRPRLRHGAAGFHSQYPPAKLHCFGAAPDYK